MLNNEGLNDRFYNTYTINQNITSDIRTDNILNSVDPSKIWFGTDWHLYMYNDDTKKKL